MNENRRVQSSELGRDVVQKSSFVQFVVNELGRCFANSASAHGGKDSRSALPSGTVSCFAFPMEVSVNEEPRPVCPKCGSDLIREIPGAGVRCQACGFQWNVSKNPVADACAARKASGVVG